VLLLKNVALAVLVLGTVVVLVPYRILTLSGQLQLGRLGILGYMGLVPILLGGGIYVWCLWGFPHTGWGTPTAIAPPKELVVNGPYRFTRNPMYLALVCAFCGEAALFASGQLLLCGLVLLAGFHLLVVLYEEPTLRRWFGSTYGTCCSTVPRWLFRRKAR